MILNAAMLVEPQTLQYRYNIHNTSYLQEKAKCPDVTLTVLHREQEHFWDYGLEGICHFMRHLSWHPDDDDKVPFISLKLKHSGQKLSMYIYFGVTDKHDPKCVQPYYSHMIKQKTVYM